jgi:hypothetical protein
MRLVSWLSKISVPRGPTFPAHLDYTFHSRVHQEAMPARCMPQKKSNMKDSGWESTFYVPCLSAACTRMIPQFTTVWVCIHVRSSADPENIYVLRRISMLHLSPSCSPLEIATAAMKKLEADVHFYAPEPGHILLCGDYNAHVRQQRRGDTKV